jgi:hypothetical protein
MYSRVIENCTHTHTLACPNPIPLGGEEEEERKRIRNGCGVYRARELGRCIIICFHIVRFPS